MRSLYSALAGFLVLLVSLVAVSSATSDAGPTHVAANASRQSVMSRMPLAFTANRGQWPENVLFRTRSGGATIWITREGLVYQFTRRVQSEDTSSLARWGAGFSGAAQDDGPLAQGKCGHEPDSIEQLVVKATFAGANAAPEPVGLEELEYKCNYFLGNDPAGWRTDVPNYAAVMVKDVYPGIDVRYSADRCVRVAYEFVAAPGADVTQIKAEYEGAEETSIDAEGKLIVRTKWGDRIEALGTSVGSRGLFCSGSYATAEHIPGAEVDHQIGEPAQSTTVELSYSTYLGGGMEDQGYAIAVDGSGNAYVTGYTSSTNFPTPGSHQTYQGNYDVYVAKLSTTGSSLVYGTYLGGGDQEYGWGIAVDGSGHAYVTGETFSSDFPTQNPYQTDQDLVDVFVTKLSSSGDSLVYSTILGGGDADQGYGIAVNDSGNAYVTGRTLSSNFPAQNPYQTDQGYWDGFVTKLSSTGNSLVYSTYLGGGDYDEGHAIAVDGSGHAYVTGATSSTDFPTQNPYQTYQGGADDVDVFVTKLSSTGNSLAYSTYLGGGGSENGRGIAVDDSGNAYVTGDVYSTDFPTQNPYQAHHAGPGYDDVFVTKLSNTGNSLAYSTYLGGGSYDYGYGIAVDGSGNAYVTGRTLSSNFPTQNPYQTDQGQLDVFVTKLSSTGNSLAYSTYLGGANYDFGFGIAVDGPGNAYVTGYTYSTDFPTQKPYQSTYQGGDAFVASISMHVCPVTLTGDVNLSGTVVTSDIIYLVNSVLKGGAAPLPCKAAGDVNCDGQVATSDIIYLVNYVLKAGSAPCNVCPMIPGTWSCP